MSGKGGAYINLAAFFAKRDEGNPDETWDGNVLAQYFGLTVVRPPRVEGPKLHDYEISVESNGYVGIDAPEGELFYTTFAEQYTANTPDLSTRGGKGVVGAIEAKGDQAPIIVVDVTQENANGQWSTSDLKKTGWNAIFWTQSASTSHVARVIFVPDGAVVADVNPFNFGPPVYNANAKAAPPESYDL